jgi:hypothetical protein
MARRCLVIAGADLRYEQRSANTGSTYSGKQRSASWYTRSHSSTHPQNADSEFGNGRFIVVAVPNITNVFYGRDVGYSFERLALRPDIESISASDQRRLIVAGVRGSSDGARRANSPPERKSRNL